MELNCNAAFPQFVIVRVCDVDVLTSAAPKFTPSGFKQTEGAGVDTFILLMNPCKDVCNGFVFGNAV